MRKENRNLIIILIFFLFYLSLFIAKFDFNPSATIGLSQSYYKFTVANTNLIVPSGVVVYNGSSGFDGQYYYIRSLDPFMEEVNKGHFDQREFYPLLVFILSLGIKNLFPLTFIIINLLAVLISSYVLMKILKKYRANINYVFIWALNVGFLISLTRNLTEPLMILFISIMVYALEEEKHWAAMIALSLAIVTRELAITVYAAVLLYFLIKREYKKFFIYLLAIIPFALWELLLFLKFGSIFLIKSSYALSFIPRGSMSYLTNTPEYFENYIFDPLIKYNSSSSLFNIFRRINRTFSALPVLIFAIILALIMLKNLIKEKRITKYTVLLAPQVVLIFLLRRSLFFEEVDAIGRYALGMFLFSILYYGERNKKYNKLLLILIILSSILYFIQRAIIPKGAFFIS